MMQLHKIYTTTFGIGYIRGGGTVAAIFWVLCWYAMSIWFPIDQTLQFLLTSIITLTGIWSAGKVETIWGKDSSKVVIDEVAGMAISLLFLPITWPVLLTALVLFRFFDIVKPLYIRKMEQLPRGWGVMADDILAGVYTNIIMWALVLFNVF